VEATVARGALIASVRGEFDFTPPGNTVVVLQDFAVLISALTGAIALSGTALACLRRWRARQVRTRLDLSVERIHRQQHRLGGAIIETDRRLQLGTDWAGWSKWPPQLAGELAYLSGLADEAEREESIVRSLEASGADERLRQDVEEMHQVIYRLANACIDGTVAAYRNLHGKPALRSSGGHEVLPVFTGMSEADIIETRRRFTTLMRTYLHRLDPGTHPFHSYAEAFDSSWTIYRWEAARID
jgi:hypothetical protein